mgnify:CR=1 FL=1
MITADARADLSHTTLADAIQLVLFCGSSAAYAIYMADLIEQSTYYASLMLLVGFCGLRAVWLVAARLRGHRRLHFAGPAAALLCAAALLVLISVIQHFLAAQPLTISSVEEALYIVVPTILAFTIVNTVSTGLGDFYVLVLLLKYVAFILIKFSADLDLSAITAIDWSDTNSSVFESSFSHDLLVLEAYFLFRRQYIRAAVAAIFTLLTFKRASFLLAPALLIVSNKLRLARTVSAVPTVALFVTGCISPFLIMAIYSDAFNDFARRTFNLDVNAFTTGRQAIYEMALEVRDIGGFGSLNPELTRLAGWNALLHNDTVRLYLEVGLFGVIGYCAAIALLARTNRLSVILVSYAFFVLITSRLITHMSFWIALLLVLALAQRISENQQDRVTNGATDPDAQMARRRSRI